MSGISTHFGSLRLAEKGTLAVVIAAVVGGLAVTTVAAQDKKVIAVVSKSLNNPFFDQAKLGCEKAAAEIGADKVECLWTGPVEQNSDDQVQMVTDLIATGVDGIAVAATNPAAMVSALQVAKDANIPVVTWDSDLLPENSYLRLAHFSNK